MIKLSDFTLEELEAEIKRRKRLMNPPFKKTKTYKKIFKDVKNFSLKINRLVLNVSETKEEANIKLEQIKMGYKPLLVNTKNLTGTQLKKGLKAIEKDMNKFEIQWKKHYKKAANAIDFLYDKETAKKYKSKLRTVIYKQAKVNYLAQIGKLKSINDDEGIYGRLFNFVLKDTYPSETEDYIQKLVKGGYSEQEIRKAKEAYQQSGQIENIRKINYNQVFEKSLRESVYDWDSENSNIFLGQKLDNKDFLNILEDEEFFE